MKTSSKTARLLGALTFAAATGLCHAQIAGPPPPDGPLQGLVSSHHGRTEKALRRFDRNHDGRITLAEMNNTIGTRFAAATHGASRMTLKQYLALRDDAFGRHEIEMFRSLDWNADGRLSLAEYAAPQRVRFITLDRRGTGLVSCATGRSGTSRGRLRRFCDDNDDNRDGAVSRAELDSAVARRFARATGGGAAMTANQFAASERSEFVRVNTRSFRRLDQDKDGTLTVREFGGNESRLFARRDKNKDHVLSENEMPRHMRSRSRRGGKKRHR